jgi:hypothetical protein
MRSMAKPIAMDALTRWLWFLAGCVLMPLSVAAKPAELRIAGSDLLGAAFEQALSDDARRSQVPMRADFSGSRAALDALKAGGADLAIILLAPDEKLPEQGFVATPLAYRIAVIAASRDTDVTQVSFTQLEGFFGASGPAGYRLWRDLGAGGQKASLTVETHRLETATDAVSIDLFRHAVLRVPRLKPTVQRHERMASLVEKLNAEPGGLAILPELPERGASLRVLMVSKKDGEPAFSPTPENIHSGDYPLRAAVWVVYPEKSAEDLRPVLRFLWSDEAARALETGSHCVAVPRSGRPAQR